jgi:septal ring-binding cell division protein DamX
MQQLLAIVPEPSLHDVENFIMSDTLQPVANPQSSERRLHSRQRVLYSCMQLEDDNGGIILNISESGLAMQAVRSVKEESLYMRFQLSQSKAWVEAQGRIAWTNASRQKAGVEFVGLPYEGRILIRRWLTVVDHLGTTAAENAPAEEIAPRVKPASATLEPAGAGSLTDVAVTERVVENPEQDLVATNPAGIPPNNTETRDFQTDSQYFRATVYPNRTTEENAPVDELAFEELASIASEPASTVSVPELETTERVVEKSEQHLVVTDPAGIPPGVSGTQDVETGSQDALAMNPMPAATENTERDTPSPLHLSYEDIRRIPAKIDREPTRSPRNSRQWTGVLFLALLLSVVLFSAFYFRHAGIKQQSSEPSTSASQPAVPSSDSMIPEKPPISADSKQPLDRPGFVLQVGAMTHKDYADALAESLRKRHFPAFVSPRGTDPFYRVVVGPYSDVDSTLKAKGELKDGGFESIRTRWNPSAAQIPHP